MVQMRADLDLLDGMTSAARFEIFASSLVGVLRHADRLVPMRDYTLGLLMPGAALAAATIAG